MSTLITNKTKPDKFWWPAMMLFWEKRLFGGDINSCLCRSVFGRWSGGAERDERGRKLLCGFSSALRYTHRLVFLNYAKLHPLWACQRVHLWAQYGSSCRMGAMVKDSPDKHTHTHTPFSRCQGWMGVRVRVRREGGSVSDRPLIPADPLIKDKIFESTDSPFLMTDPLLQKRKASCLVRIMSCNTLMAHRKICSEQFFESLLP